MQAESNATRILMLIPVFAVLLALAFSLLGLNTGPTHSYRPSAPRAFILAAVCLSDAFHPVVSNAQALLKLP